MLALCERFGKLPSEIYAEDAGFARMLQLEALVREVDPRNEDLG